VVGDRATSMRLTRLDELVNEQAIWMRRAYVVASVALIAVYPLFSKRGRSAVFLAMAVSAVALVSIGLRSVEPGRRLPWRILVAALIAVSIGNLLGVVLDGTADAPGSLFDAAGNALVFAAALALVARRGRSDFGGIIDAAIVALAVGGVLFQVVIRGHLVGAYQSGASRVDIIVALFALSGVVGALVRLAQTNPESAAALRLLIAALALAIGGNLLYVTEQDSWPHTVGGLMFLGAYVAVGLFGLDPRAALLAQPAVTSNHETISAPRLIFLGLAVSVIPVTAGAQALAGMSVDGSILIAGCVSIAVLVMARIGRLAAERERAEKALSHNATHDPLTDLPNRRSFIANLETRTEQGDRSLILFCDLNEFKAVNDRFGHAAGDELLVEVANRLRTCVRDTDMVSRFGGDEFLILLDNALPAQAEMICRRIASALSDPFFVHGVRISVGASIGVAVAAPDTDAEVIIKRADYAMYSAKRARPTRDGIHMTPLASLDVQD
jgi:diguanylate cyclase